MILQPYLLYCALALTAICAPAAAGQAAQGAAGRSVLKAEALLTTAVGGLERTNAAASVVPVSDEPFASALLVTIGTASADTNATQLTMPIAVPVQKGDALLATFYVRGATASSKRGQVALLFEKAVDPWTKSVAETISTAASPEVWRRVVVPFTAAESYKPGEAMVSLRFAFGPQTVQVGGLEVVDYGTARSLKELIRMAAEANPLGDQQVAIDLKRLRQPIVGFGGNFTKPRYGATEPFDSVARYNLAHLDVRFARVGIPLNDWAPQKGVYHDDAQAHAALLQLQEFARRGIPIVASVWEGPAWLLPGKPEETGRRLAPELYADCAEAIAQFLVTARDKYGAQVDDFSFNEADYGINFHFTSQEIVAFIRQAGPRFGQLGLKTKFLVGDTGGGGEMPDYARPILEARDIGGYLGPIAFHCWDALGVADARYEAIAALGAQYAKPIWCTEAGHDAALWQRSDPWASWDNGLRTALAYVKTLRLTGARVMAYWTYEDDYPLVDPKTSAPYPVWYVVRQMQQALPPGAHVAEATSQSDDLDILASAGPHPGEFSVLLVNPIGAGRVTLAGLPAGAVVQVETMTDQTPHGARIAHATIDAHGQVAVAMPSRSVVAVIREATR